MPVDNSNSSKVKSLLLMIDEGEEKHLHKLKQKISSKASQNFKGIREAFRYFDINKEGKVSINDFCSSIMNL